MKRPGGGGRVHNLSFLEDIFTMYKITTITFHVLKDVTIRRNGAKNVILLQAKGYHSDVTCVVS